jgi:hypothetical protein
VLLLPAILDEVDTSGVLRLLDGLPLTGSCWNIEPGRYGKSAFPDGQGGDARRDDVGLRYAAAMIEAGKPVFGICRDRGKTENAVPWDAERGRVGARPCAWRGRSRHRPRPLRGWRAR